MAGAGSGKTRTITYRVAYLLEKGIKPENILLLTFTNKAANEMVKRVTELTKSDSKLPYAGTFHSIANKILRRYATQISYQGNFSILDTDDSKTILKLCIKTHKPPEARKFPSVNIVQNTLSYAKNSGEDLKEVIELKCPHFSEFLDEFRKISFEYEKRKKESNSMDFDDLLINLNLLLDNSDIGKKFAEQFQYVLVDEYQDTNKIQSEIIDKFASVHKNILVVGDDAQSIYSFRAAKIENILGFENKYNLSTDKHGGAKIFKLETNYRSSQEILDIANDVIENNLSQYKKQLRALENSGVKPKLVPQSDVQDEAIYIISKIKELNGYGTPNQNIAILFRASHHSQRLEMELVKSGIEYDYRGGMRFFERAHIKDVLAFLRILNNPKDTTSWIRLLTKEVGIGPSAAEKIINAIQSSIIIPAKTENSTTKQLDSYLHKNDIEKLLSKKAKLGFQNFLSIFTNLLKTSENFPATLIRTIKESNYKNYLQNEFTDAKERMQDIDELSNFAEKYSNLNDFLSEATLQEKHTSAQINENEEKTKKIVLSTIHQSKGLEWDAVFIINLTSTGFPNERASATNDGLEEERRLFYVATTRAKQHLYLTYPMEQSGWGERINEPSMFLGEISMDKIEDHSMLSPVSSLALNELNDDNEDVKYVTDDYNYNPGSFLKSIDDL